MNFHKEKKLAEASLKAEDEGFEPPVPCGTTVFKTAAIDHSANPPIWTAKVVIFTKKPYICN